MTATTTTAKNHDNNGHKKLRPQQWRPQKNWRPQTTTMMATKKWRLPHRLNHSSMIFAFNIRVNKGYEDDNIGLKM